MISNGSMTEEHVCAKELITSALTINSTTVTQIESANAASTADALITRSVLDNELSEINRALKSVDPEGDLFQDLSVISMSLVDSYFSRSSDWKSTKWELRENYAYCNGGEVNNSLAIDKSVYSNIGMYYCLIDVGAIPSGYLELRLNNTFIAKLSEVKQYVVEVKISDIVTDTISLVGVDIGTGESIRINSFGFYYITPRFYTYLMDRINKLMNISSENFVTVEDNEHYRDVLMGQFQTLTSRYLLELNNHIFASNPHNITCELINAAPINHTHSEYIPRQELPLVVGSLLGNNYSKVGHTHAEYIPADTAVQYINDTVSARITSLTVLPQCTITSGPQGILPSRYVQTNLTEPLTLLVPSIVNHTEDSNYDYDAGIITTNLESLMPVAMNLFSPDRTNKVTISSEALNKEATFRIQLNSTRIISGYRIICSDNKLVDWKVISGNTTFIHRVIDPSNYVLDGIDYVSETYFDTPVETDSLAFICYRAEQLSLAVNMKIELIYTDLDLTSFGITKDAFTICVPVTSSNYVYKRDAVSAIEKHTPTVQVNDVPLYVYALPYNQDTLYYRYSYYPLEVNNVRKGLNVYLDRYTNIANVPINGAETYTHPAYGALTLADGNSATGSSLNTIYDSTNNSWKSAQNTTRVTITQSIIANNNIRNVLLMGYSLSWRVTDADNIPDSWTLTVEGVDKNNVEVTAIFDSVEKYYPFYSVDDDDIVYHARFKDPIKIRKVYLTATANSTKVIAINKLYFYLSEYFYTPSMNTMYLGLDTTTQICLGTATKHANTGWSTENICVGKSCTLPVNNMEITEYDGKYQVRNPFFTTDVIVTVHSYQLKDDESLATTPSAFVSDISREFITVTTTVPFRYAITITRSW